MAQTAAEHAKEQKAWVDSMRTMSADDAKAWAERDLERLDAAMPDGHPSTAEERQLRIDAIDGCAAVNPHYRATIEELSPTLLKRSSQEASADTDIPDRSENLDSLRRRARSEADVLESPEDSRSELLHIDDLDGRGREYNFQPGKAELEELRARTPRATLEDSRSEILEADARRREAETGAIEERIRRANERERREYMMDDPMDGMGVTKRTGFVLPQAVAQKYIEVDGKYYTKDSKTPRMMFEDRGNALRTSTTDRGAIEDMVNLARAKQWNTLKVTGSREFRREAWLQAESQGIKTRGFSPKETDLVALEALRQERATQAAGEQQERRVLPPRHDDLNKNQAQIHVDARERIAENVDALKQNPTLAGRSAHELERIAYFRGILQEDIKSETPEAQREILTDFERAVEAPAYLKRLEEIGQDHDTQEQQTERQQERQEARKKTSEQSLER